MTYPNIHKTLMMFLNGLIVSATLIMGFPHMVYANNPPYPPVIKGISYKLTEQVIQKLENSPEGAYSNATLENLRALKNIDNEFMNESDFLSTYERYAGKRLTEDQSFVQTILETMKTEEFPTEYNTHCSHQLFSGERPLGICTDPYIRLKVEVDDPDEGDSVSVKCTLPGVQFNLQKGLTNVPYTYEYERSSVKGFQIFQHDIETYEIFPAGPRTLRCVSTDQKGTQAEATHEISVNGEPSELDIEIDSSNALIYRPVTFTLSAKEPDRLDKITAECTVKDRETGNAWNLNGKEVNVNDSTQQEKYDLIEKSITFTTPGEKEITCSVTDSQGTVSTESTRLVTIFEKRPTISLDFEPVERYSQIVVHVGVDPSWEKIACRAEDSTLYTERNFYPDIDKKKQIDFPLIFTGTGEKTISCQATDEEGKKIPFIATKKVYVNDSETNKLIPSSGVITLPHDKAYYWDSYEDCRAKGWIGVERQLNGKYYLQAPNFLNAQMLDFDPLSGPLPKTSHRCNGMSLIEIREQIYFEVLESIFLPIKSIDSNAYTWEALAVKTYNEMNFLSKFHSKINETGQNVLQVADAISLLEELLVGLDAKIFSSGNEVLSSARSQLALLAVDGYLKLDEATMKIVGGGYLMQTAKWAVAYEALNDFYDALEQAKHFYVNQQPDPALDNALIRIKEVLRRRAEIGFSQIIEQLKLGKVNVEEFAEESLVPLGYGVAWKAVIKALGASKTAANLQALGLVAAYEIQLFSKDIQKTKYRIAAISTILKYVFVNRRTEIKFNKLLPDPGTDAGRTTWLRKLLELRIAKLFYLYSRVWIELQGSGFSLLDIAGLDLVGFARDIAGKEEFFSNASKEIENRIDELEKERNRISKVFEKSQDADNAPPIADIWAYTLSAHAPATVTFNGSNSYDPDSEATMHYHWDFGDESSTFWPWEEEFWPWGDEKSQVEHTFKQAGEYEVTLSVLCDNKRAQAKIKITVLPPIAKVKVEPKIIKGLIGSSHDINVLACTTPDSCKDVTDEVEWFSLPHSTVVIQPEQTEKELTILKSTPTIMAAVYEGNYLKPGIMYVHSPRFWDVSPQNWFYKYVMTLKIEEIISGYKDGTFRPFSEITRAEFIKMAVAAYELEPYQQDNIINLPANYTDIAGHWSESFIQKAWKFGWLDTSKQRFQPETFLNRAEASKILAIVRLNMEGKSIEELQTVNDSPYKDVSPEKWYAPYVLQLRTDKIIQGYPDGTFRPGRNINRAEAAKMICETFPVLRKQLR